jgi:hypothetical protein
VIKLFVSDIYVFALDIMSRGPFHKSVREVLKTQLIVTLGLAFVMYLAGSYSLIFLAAVAIFWLVVAFELVSRNYIPINYGTIRIGCLLRRKVDRWYLKGFPENVLEVEFDGGLRREVITRFPLAWLDREPRGLSGELLLAVAVHPRNDRIACVVEPWMGEVCLDGNRWREITTPLRQARSRRPFRIPDS